MATVEAIRAVLKRFNEFPSKHRLTIYGFLLQLTNNRNIQLLLERSRSVEINYLDRYPIGDSRIALRFNRIMSAISCYSESLSQAVTTAHIVFPFVRLFGNDMMNCLEASLVFIYNWCLDWYKLSPHPPIHVLAYVNKLLSFHCPSLLEHFENLKVSSQIYSWKCLQTIFSSNFPGLEWLRLFDHIISNPPHFIYYVMASMLIESRYCLLKIHSYDEMVEFFAHHIPVHVDSVLTTAYALMLRTPKNLVPIKVFCGFSTSGPLPMFPAFSGHLDNFHLKERERIMEEEHQIGLKESIRHELGVLQKMLEAEKTSQRTSKRDFEESLDLQLLMKNVDYDSNKRNLEELRDLKLLQKIRLAQELHLENESKRKELEMKEEVMLRQLQNCNEKDEQRWFSEKEGILNEIRFNDLEREIAKRNLETEHQRNLNEMHSKYILAHEYRINKDKSQPMTVSPDTDLTSPSIKSNISPYDSSQQLTSMSEVIATPSSVLNQTHTLSPQTVSITSESEISPADVQYASKNNKIAKNNRSSVVSSESPSTLASKSIINSSISSNSDGFLSPSSVLSHNKSEGVSPQSISMSPQAEVSPSIQSNISPHNFSQHLSCSSSDDVLTPSSVLDQTPVQHSNQSVSPNTYSSKSTNSSGWITFS
eukprot:TRINITY_DN1022_c0_g1_i1.p1 TRINITY_DN1022_c0_g1~~TRINITY_DN1022_c0_g1_i1.p1  ORF type:complete len:658 (-),score=170.34 TRINITY_DN1022_c0_g1_i1:1561-3507(-)